MLHPPSADAGLISALSLNDLAPLASVCRTWLDWLLHSPSTVARKRSLAPSAFPLFLACSWAKRMLRTLILLPETVRQAQHGHDEMPESVAEDADRLEYVGWWSGAPSRQR